MPRRTPVAALLATTALLTIGLPAAHAASPAAVQKQVGSHLKHAQADAKKVTRLTRRGDAAGARKALKSARHEAVAAARGARLLAAGAQDNLPAAQTAIWSLAAAAGTYGDAMQRFSGLIPAAGSTQLQQSLAGALPGTVAGHEQLIAELTTLVDELSGQAQALAAQVLAALQAAAPQQVQQLAEVAGTEDLPTQISTLIQQALSTATMALKTGLASLTAALPELPAGTESQITTALGGITAAMQQLMPLLQQVIGIATGAATTGIQQAHSMLQGLLGGLLGTFLGDAPTGGTPPATGDSTGGLGGLLGGLFKLPTSLPSGILGGLSGLLGGFIR
jgi:hypothetical protein